MPLLTVRRRMKKNLKILIIFFLLLILPVFFIPDDCLAYNFANDSGLRATGQGTGHTSIGITQRISQSPGQVIGTIIKALLSFLGVIFLLLMIYSGYTWMMSRGNEGDIEKAKNTIINASIGLIIVLAAYALTAFIGGQLIGSAAVG